MGQTTSKTPVKQIPNPKGYKFHALQPAPLCVPSAPCKAKSLSVPGALALFIEPFLTVTEALGFETLAKEYPKEYRDNDRVLLGSHEIATNLYTRLLLSCEKYLHGAKPFGFGTEGVWLPVGVNPIIKVARYNKGHKFLPHIDNSVVLNENERSIFTAIVYLNDNFKGGATKFYKRTKENNELPFLDPSTLELLETVKPIAGACLLFNHDVIHEGETLLDNCKYILRMEIMFQKQSASGSVLNSYRVADKSFLQSNSLYLLSDDLEQKGALHQATKQYLKALAIQAFYSPSVATGKDLPYEVVQIILQFADMKTVIATSLVNRRWQYVATESIVWQRLYKQRWKTIPKQVLHLNWYYCYRDKNRTEKHKGILVIDFGSAFIRAGFCGTLHPSFVEPSSYQNFGALHSFDSSDFLVGRRGKQHVVPFTKVFYPYYIYYGIAAICKEYNCLPAKLDPKASCPVFISLGTINIGPHYYLYGRPPNFEYKCNDYDAAIIGANLQNGILVHCGHSTTYVIAVQNGTRIELSKHSYGASMLLPFVKDAFNAQKHTQHHQKKVLVQIARMRTHITEVIDTNTMITYTFKKKQYKANLSNIVNTCEFIFSDINLAQVILQLANKQMDLLQNIVLSGGSTMITNFATRLQEELASQTTAPFQIVAHPQRDMFSWLGANKIAVQDQELPKYKFSDPYHNKR